MEMHETAETLRREFLDVSLDRSTGAVLSPLLTTLHELVEEDAVTAAPGAPCPTARGAWAALLDTTAAAGEEHDGDTSPFPRMQDVDPAVRLAAWIETRATVAQLVELRTGIAWLSDRAPLPLQTSALDRRCPECSAAVHFPESGECREVVAPGNAGLVEDDDVRLDVTTTPALEIQFPRNAVMRVVCRSCSATWPGAAGVAEMLDRFGCAQ